MNRVKKSKKTKNNSQDEYCPQEDLVQSSHSDIQYEQYEKLSVQEKPSKKKIIIGSKSQKILSPKQQSYQGQKPKVANKKTLSIEEIKQQILIHTPDMKDQMKELDDKTIRQIYYSIVEPNTNKLQQEQSKIQSLLPEQQEKRIAARPQRSPQIQKMYDSILKHVPHMRQTMEEFDDEDIVELYNGYFPNIHPVQNQSNKQPIIKTQPMNNSKYKNENLGNGNKSANIKSMRNFILQNLPQMKGQIDYLSNEDVIEVYQLYQKNQKEKQQNLLSNFGSNIQSQSFKPGITNKAQNISPLLMYDPLKKFQNKNSSMIKRQPEADYANNFGSGPHSYGQFNNYKYNNYNNNRYSQGLASSYGNKSNGVSLSQGIYNNSSSTLQVHNFHNYQRVNNLPLNQQNLVRTVVIIHTMQPGYVPSASKSKCRCHCCMRRQAQTGDPNVLNEFIQSIIPKYSSRK